MPKIEGDAKERVLDEALALFSVQGYEGTTMRDIADAAGIKAASLYNHFPGKRELFNALINREKAYIEDTLHAFGAVSMPDDDPSAYSTIDDDALCDLVWRSYEPFFCNERVKSVFRMLNLSRYGDENCEGLFHGFFFERPHMLQERIFTHLIETGIFEQCDVSLAAREFHGPMLALMCLEAEPSEAQEFCARHMARFNSDHRKRNGNGNNEEVQTC